MNGVRGMTLVEVMVAMVISLVLITALLAGILGIISLNLMARHHMQATNVARGMIEELKGTVYANIADEVRTDVPYDAGDDQVFGTADDLTGTLTVTIQDFLDMDNDADTTETDGGGFFGNMAKPVRVEFQWNERFLGVPRTMTITIDTLVAV